LGGAEQRRLSINDNFPPKKSGRSPTRRAKRKGVWGKEFLPACSVPTNVGAGGGKRRRFSASAEGQSRKFFFLKGKIKREKARAKNNEKNFLLCSPQGERRRREAHTLSDKLWWT